MLNPFETPTTTTIEDIRRREQEVARREAEVEIREREFSKREQGGAGFVPAPNFPPCRPSVYHDINAEIPEEHRRMVRFAFYNWILYCVALIWNFFAICVYMDISLDFSFIFLALIWLVLCGPVGFNSSYMSLYKGVKDKSTTSIFWYLFTWGCATALAILMLIGVPDTGSSGLVMIFKAEDEGKGFVTFTSGISLGLWGATTMLCLYVEKSVWIYYQGRGGNEAAKKEARKDIAKAAINEAAESV